MFIKTIALLFSLFFSFCATAASYTTAQLSSTHAVQDTKRIIVKPWKVDRTFEYKKIYTDFNLGTLQKGPGVFINMGFVKQVSKLKGYGLGIDYTDYSFEQPHGFIAPHVVYRGYIINKKNGLFVTGRAGYGFSVSDRQDGEFEGRGGLYTEASINARIGLTKPIVVAGVGLRTQRVDIDFVSPGTGVTQNGWFRRLVISLGIMF